MFLVYHSVYKFPDCNVEGTSLIYANFYTSATFSCVPTGPTTSYEPMDAERKFFLHLYVVIFIFSSFIYYKAIRRF